MDEYTLKFGTRKLQLGTGGYTINIPLVLVDSFELTHGDKMVLTATVDGKIMIEKYIDESVIE